MDHKHGHSQAIGNHRQMHDQLLIIGHVDDEMTMFCVCIQDSLP